MVEMAKIHCFSALLVRKKKKKTTATTTTTKDSPKVVENAKNGILQLRLESLVHPSDDIRAKEATLDATIPAHDSKIIGDDQLDGMDGAYEGGDEHDDAPSMRRDFSDFDLQAKAAAEQGEDAGANGGSLDEKPEGGRAAAEVAILSGHISDPGFGQKSDLCGSPWLKRSCSNIETRAAAACLPPLSPSKSLSYEDLQALLGNGNGGVPHEFNGSPLSVITACSADRVILKKKSSSQVLPSRSRKLWWRLFLWSHRNLHSSWNYSAQQRVPAPYDGFNSRKGGYSSDTLEPGHGNEGQDAAAGCGRSQWMAFSMDSSSSPLDRVNAWVNSLEDNPCSSVDFDAAETPAFPDSPEAGEQARKNSQQHQSGRRQAEELFRANHVIQSLNPLSTVAHISGMGLQVVPTISPFTSLRAVNLSGNSIAHISPGALPKSLHALDLSRNRITAIEGLRDLTRLRVLNLSYNKISRIGHGLSNCILIKELYLAGNKISNVEGLHRLLKLAVLDLSFNKLTTAKALGQLVANYNSLLVLNLLGNPVQSNVGDDQLRKVVAGLLPQLTYLNKQPIKPQRAREGAADTIAKAALGHNTAWRRPTRRASQGAAAATAASSANRGRPVGGASAGHGTARRRRKPKLPTSAGRR